MFGLGAPELIVVLLVVLLLFGSTKLPKLARSLGQASQEFKQGISEKSADDPDAIAAPAPKPSDPKPSDRVVMTQAELDALLAEREAQVRRETPPSSAAS
ncbi:MAG: sec-independent protein translocase protein TatA [Actinomycetota bacterium]|jgi:sec-independent protein translocase protein TatA|nr:sec-independent protein translocase protein TatA [Actinomycetota bacterium]